eukprot:CAMPEP_0117003706 /NCGR_PEP_ID=MMETSP0472-20121206/4933_1 /TAXON_ID=693140 ORGANISM="Tiarina fusus, Strain LIS" /NCGR_SAMPLE_ID=MMETSP0472 /ASSEMBLY_ACC=CAM_ASM_000603 /LENGTH=250 /DNA_ID=CAMNT_0004704437 /DNA_START=74 /DNA_END=829 /DNA_ORIENTATION=+
MNHPPPSIAQRTATMMSSWRSLFFCSCTDTTPHKYLPEDEPELIWPNPSYYSSTSSSSAYRDVVKKSAPPRPPRSSSSSPSSNDAIVHLTFPQVPLRRTTASMDTQTTVTMNTISFDDEDDWEDDDYFEDDLLVVQRPPELALSKSKMTTTMMMMMTPYDIITATTTAATDTGCGPIGCGYSSTALMGEAQPQELLQDDDEDELEDDIVAHVGVGQSNHNNERPSSLSSSPQHQQVRPQRQRELPQAWSW